MNDKSIGNRENCAGPAIDDLPMECRRSGVLIEKVLAGAATETEQAELNAHLEGCADCRTYRADAEALSAAFRGIRLRYAQAPEVAPRRRGRLLRYAPLAAAAAVLIAAGLCIYSFRLFEREQPAGALAETTTESAPETASRTTTEPEAPDTIAEHLGVALAVRPTKVTGEVGRTGKGEPFSRVPRQGLLVIEVAPGSWAESVGIQPGDRILEVSGVLLVGKDGYRWLGYVLRNLRPDTRLILTVLRGNRPVSLEYRADAR